MRGRSSGDGGSVGLVAAGSRGPRLHDVGNLGSADVDLGVVGAERRLSRGRAACVQRGQREIIAEGVHAPLQLERQAIRPGDVGKPAGRAVDGGRRLDRDRRGPSGVPIDGRHRLRSAGHGLAVVRLICECDSIRSRGNPSAGRGRRERRRRRCQVAVDRAQRAGAIQAHLDARREKERHQRGVARRRAAQHSGLGDHRRDLALKLSVGQAGRVRIHKAHADERVTPRGAAVGGEVVPAPVGLPNSQAEPPVAP